MTDFEGAFEASDGVQFEARHQPETGMYILSRLDDPTDLRVVDEEMFIETVLDGTVTALEADR